MLIVDFNALLTVHRLNGLNQIILNGLHAGDPQHVLRIERAVCDGLTLLHDLAVGNLQAYGVGHLIDLHLAVVRGNGNVTQSGAVGIVDGHHTGDFGNLSHLLRPASLKQLFHSGKTLGDIVTGNAAGVEGTHGQLRTGLTDGLGCDNADGLAQVNLLGGGQVHAVALCAHAHPGPAGQNGADIDFVDAVGLELGGILRHHHHVLGVQQLACSRIHHIVDGITAPNPAAEGIDDVAVLVVDRTHPDTVLRAAVVLADDDLLGHIHHSAGQVTGVGGTKGGIGHALTGASGGDEVLQNGQALTEVCLNGNFDGTAGGICHQATHTCQLTNLSHGATGAGVGHHVDGVELIQVALKGIGNFLGGLLPLLNHQTVTLVIGDIALAEVVFNFHHLVLSGLDQFVLDGGNHHIRNGHGDSALGGVLVAQSLDPIQHFGGDGEAVNPDTLVDDLAQLLLADQEVNFQVEGMGRIAAVYEAQILGDRLIVNQAAHGGVDHLITHLPVHFLAVAHQDRRMQTDGTVGVGGDGLLGGGIGVDGTELGFLFPFLLGLLVGSHEVIGIHYHTGSQAGLPRVGDEHGFGALFRLAQTGIGQVVGTQNHILGRHGNRLAVLRTEQVVGGEHQHSGFRLSLRRQRNVNGHLVAVEVRIEGGAAQGVQLQSPALHQHRLEGLNAQTVQGRRPVQHNGPILDDVVQSVPDLGLALVDHLLGGLDVVGQAVGNQLLHDEGPEQLNGHFLGHAALVELQFRADHDNGTAGVVNTLAQQILTEPALLALEHVGQGLQCPVVGTGDGTAPAAVVDQSVHSLLEHPLFVADDDVRGVELNQPLQAVIPVDDPAIQIVQVGGCEPAAVQLNHRTDIGRNHGQHVHDHPAWLVAGLPEGLHYLQTLDNAQLLLGGGGLQLVSQLLGQLIQVNLLQQFLDGLGTHTGLEVVLVLFPHVPVFLLGEHLVPGQGRVTGIGDNIGREVQHLLQNLGADVQHQTHPGGNALEIPDMAAGSGQLNVTHALPAHLGFGDLDAAAVADLALVLDFLVLAAVAFPVLGGSENPLAVQSVPLGFQGTVVDGFRLLDLAVGPLPDHLRGRNTNFNGIKGGICHV